MTKAIHNGLNRKELINNSVNYLRENQLEALKSLALLLLREVEALQKTPAKIDEDGNGSGANLLERTQQYEADLIRATLIKTNGNQRQAAKLLGTKETTLNVKIKRYQIDEANQRTLNTSSNK